MSRKKTESVCFRLTPAVRSMVEQVAKSERRSLSNLLEIMAIDYCARLGIHPAEEPPKEEEDKK